MAGIAALAAAAVDSDQDSDGSLDSQGNNKRKGGQKDTSERETAALDAEAAKQAEAAKDMTGLAIAGAGLAGATSLAAEDEEE